MFFFGIYYAKRVIIHMFNNHIYHIDQNRVV